MTPSSLTRPGLLWLACCLCFAVAPLAAAVGGFTATLAAEEKTAAGLSDLTEDERTALDQLVADDLAYARREKLTDLGGTFVSRRSEAARKQAGLDRLTAEQLDRLNELVSTALAARPVPKERPRLKEKDVLAAGRRAEIHGSVTVAYGWGRGGRDYRAGSLWLEYVDPDNRYSLGVGVTTSEGGYGYYPGYYPGYTSGYFPGDYYYPGFYSYEPSYYSSPRVILGTNYRADSRSGNFSSGGGCLRGVPTGGRGGGGRRH